MVSAINNIPKEERFNTLTHFLAALASIFATGLFTCCAIRIDLPLGLCVLITCSSFIFLFSASFLYHANKRGGPEESIWLKIDHSAIFVMMAGSYVGPMYIYASGAILWGVLAAVWSIALLGLAVKLKYLITPNWFNLLMYAPLCIISAIPIAMLWSSFDSITDTAVSVLFLKSLLVGGLAVYTAGGIIYAAQKPDPRPDTVGFHGIFHCCVITGAGLHAVALFYSIQLYPVIREHLIRSGI